MDELFDALIDGVLLDGLFGLFGGGGPSGDPFEPGPSVPELEKAIARENARRNVAQLARLEHDRRTRQLDLPDFRRRYARLAGREPVEDPARLAPPYGPSSAEIDRFTERLRAMEARDWDRAGEHLANLQANVVVRRAVLPRYRAALDAAIGAARLTAVAAVHEALHDAVPEPRRETWRLTLAWLPVVLVTDPGSASASIAAALGG